MLKTINIPHVSTVLKQNVNINRQCKRFKLSTFNNILKLKIFLDLFIIKSILFSSIQKH